MNRNEPSNFGRSPITELMTFRREYLERELDLCSQLGGGQGWQLRNPIASPEQACEARPLSLDHSEVDCGHSVASGCEAGKINPKLDHVCAVKNLRREHVRCLIHIHRSDKEHVPRPFQLLWHVPARLSTRIEGYLLPGLHGRQNVREIPFDMGEVHLVENQDVWRLGVVVRVQ